MSRLRYLWVGPLIGFLIGLFIIEDEVPIRIISGVTLALLGLATQLFIFYGVVKAYKKDLGFLKGEQKFISTILMLAAEVAKADGKVSQHELALIKKRLTEEYDERAVSHYFEEFELYCKQSNSLRKLCLVIDYEFDDAGKSHLMYLLISIASVDGILTNNELTVIQRIAKMSGIRMGTVTSTLKLFQFKREQSQGRKSHQKSRQNNGNTKRRTPVSKVKQAYSLLNIKPNASADEIKKAYRKLAKIHHPDKVAHLGEAHQNKAKEKFQLIVDAYELVKK